MDTVPEPVTRHTVGEEREKKVRILLAEDYPTNRQVALWHLRRAGYRVDLAENGQQAVEAYKRKHYDLILMDIEMPVMDGFEATKRIRNSEEKLKAQSSKLKANRSISSDKLSTSGFQLSAQSERVPIVAMTAHVMKGDREKCMEAGMDDYVAKPIDPEDLFSTLDKWIKPGKREADVEVPVDHNGGEEVEEGLPPKLPGIHIEEGLRRLAGNKKLFKKLLEVFSTEFACGAEEIRNAFEAQEMEVVRRLVHTLKGVAGNISANDLHAAAQELEMAVKEGAWEKCDMLLGSVERAMSQVLESIRVHINRI